MSMKAASQIQVNSSTDDTDFHRLSNDDDNDNSLRDVNLTMTITLTITAFGMIPFLSTDLYRLHRKHASWTRVWPPGRNHYRTQNSRNTQKHTRGACMYLRDDSFFVNVISQNLYMFL